MAMHKGMAREPLGGLPLRCGPCLGEGGVAQPPPQGDAVVHLAEGLVAAFLGRTPAGHKVCTHSAADNMVAHVFVHGSPVAD